MSHVIVGTVVWLACYGLLTVVSDVLRRIDNRDLRKRGHDLADCEICSGRLRTKHIRAIKRWMIKRGAP